MRILVAGIGNIFLGDDAFGVETVQALARESLPEQVRAGDFGIRSYDLAFAMTGGYDAAILLDAAPRGQSPGTLYLIEPDLAPTGEPDAVAINAHDIDAVGALELARSLGPLPPRLYLVGCEPAVLETSEFGLSEPVKAAVPQAVAMIKTLVDELLRSEVQSI